MRLVIAEKPSLARAIAEGFGSPKPSSGYIHCAGDIVVTWCFGHLLEQAAPEHYDAAYKQWSLRTLPIIPSRWVLLPRKDSQQQLGVIRKLLPQAQEVIHAGDPDREGQLLVDELLEYLGWRGKTSRIWLNAVDEKSVARALASIDDNVKRRPLMLAALARSRADWLIGLNMTRAVTLTAQNRGVELSGKPLSNGRVQTPTLALIVARDRQIEGFIPKDYFSPVIQVDHAAGRFEASWLPAEGAAGVDPEGYLVSEDAAQALRRKVTGQPGVVVQASYTTKNEKPERPYCLSKLQKAANSAFGFTVQQTLDIAQALYEKKYTSYPRSDCEFLPEEQFGEAAGILSTLAEAGLPEAGRADPKLKSPAWDSQKVTAHHAIIPTGVRPVGLTEAERGVFELIARAYIRQFYPEYSYIEQAVVVDVSGEKWKGTGRQILSMGWRAIGAPSDDQKGTAQSLPPKVAQGDAVRCAGCEIGRSKTKPPARWTDGTIVVAMAKIHLYVDDPKVKAVLKETSGIGTEATRGNILETLEHRGYIIHKGKSIISTPLGRALIDNVPAPMKDVGTTAMWEDALGQVANGKASYEAFMEQIVKLLPRLLAAAQEAKFSSLAQAGGGHKCPVPGCDGMLRRFPSKKVKGAYFWACYNEVGHAKPAFFSDDGGRPGRSFEDRPAYDGPTAPCPVKGCGKPMRLKTSQKNPDFKFWACEVHSHPLRRDENGVPGDELTFGSRSAGGGRGGKRKH